VAAGKFRERLPASTGSFSACAAAIESRGKDILVLAEDVAGAE
jgi:hypothetical protein